MSGWEMSCMWTWSSKYRRSQVNEEMQRLWLLLLTPIPFIQWTLGFLVYTTPREILSSVKKSTGKILLPFLWSQVWDRQEKNKRSREWAGWRLSNHVHLLKFLAGACKIKGGSAGKKDLGVLVFYRPVLKARLRLRQVIELPWTSNLISSGFMILPSLDY